MGGLKKIFFGDAALILLSDWEGKNIGEEMGNFSLHFGSLQAARIPFKTIFLEPSILLLQDALVWDVHLISN